MLNLATSCLEDSEDLGKHPTVPSRHAHLDSCFASLAPEEMLASGQVGRRISWTKLDHESTQRQLWDPGIRVLFKAMERLGIPKDEYISFPR